MKTTIITAILLVSISFASYSQTTFGIRGGVNFQNLNGKDAAGDKLENKVKVGVNVGVTADIPVVAPDYFVQTGLLFSTKGAKLDNVGSNDKINISYLEVPITFLYKPMLGTGRLLLGVGPYIGFAVGGKAGDQDLKFDNQITVQQANGAYLKRFDAGGNIIAGYQFTNHLSAQLNAQLGLVNINPKIEGGLGGDASVKNTGFGVSLGYSF